MSCYIVHRNICVYMTSRLNSSNPLENVIENTNTQRETQLQTHENMIVTDNPAYESNNPKNLQSNKQYQHSTLEPTYETISPNVSQINCEAENEQGDQYIVLDQSRYSNRRCLHGGGWKGAWLQQTAVKQRDRACIQTKSIVICIHWQTYINDMSICFRFLYWIHETLIAALKILTALQWWLSMVDWWNTHECSAGVSSAANPKT